MDRIRTVLTIAAIVGALTTSGYSQEFSDCDSCGTTAAGPQGVNGFFIGQTRVRDHLIVTPSEWHAYKAHAEIIRQRNEAWPKPFQCHTRQNYFATLYPMYRRGYEIQSTLTDAHFKDDSVELNSAGKRKIAGIMQNLPAHRRQILVFRDGDIQRSQARLDSVRGAVSEWFGHLNAPEIALTTNPTYHQSGAEIEQFNTRFLGALPQPGIAVGGGGAGGGAGGGGGGTGGGN